MKSLIRVRMGAESRAKPEFDVEVPLHRQGGWREKPANRGGKIQSKRKLLTYFVDLTEFS